MDSPDVHFQYPQLPYDEVIEALEGCWGLQVSRAQIQKPSPELVHSLYSFFLERLTGITLDTLQEPTHAALSMTDDEYADLYSHALAHALFLHHLTRLADCAKIDGFCSRDLAFPEPNRTRCILSGFINFARFVEDKEERVHQLWKGSDRAVEERATVEMELKELKANLAKIQSQRAQDDPQCQVLQGENAKITEDLIATKEIQGKLVEETQELKKEKNELIHSKDSLSQEIGLVADQIVRLRSRVVQSPERIKRNIVQMGSAAQEERRLIAENENKARQLEAKAEALTAIDQELSENIEQLRAMELETKALESACQSLGDLKRDFEIRQRDKKEIAARQERLKTQLRNAEEKLSRAQKHVSEKQAASASTMERLQREYEQMAAERRDNDKQVEEARREAVAIERKMTEHLRRSETELNELLSVYWGLRHRVDVYMETLANKLGIRPIDS